MSNPSPFLFFPESTLIRLYIHITSPKCSSRLWIIFTLSSPMSTSLSSSYLTNGQHFPQRIMSSFLEYIFYLASRTALTHGSLLNLSAFQPPLLIRMYLTTSKFWSIPRLDPYMDFFSHYAHPWSEFKSYEFKYCIYPNISQPVSLAQWTLYWYMINSTAFESHRCL